MQETTNDILNAGTSTISNATSEIEQLKEKLKTLVNWTAQAIQYSKYVLNTKNISVGRRIEQMYSSISEEHSESEGGVTKLRPQQNHK